MHSHVYLTRHRILIGIVCIYVAAAMLNVHFLFSMRVIPVAVCNSSAFTIGFVVASQKTEPFGYSYGRYSLIVFIIAAQIIPLIAVIILNSWLVYILKSAKYVSKQLSIGSASARKQERQITIVVIAIITSFVLFNIPSAVIWAIHLSNGLSRMPKKFYIAAEIANIFVAAGKTINFVVYFCCSKQFRKRIRGIFICSYSAILCPNIILTMDSV